MQNTRVNYPTTPEFATDSKGNKFPLLHRTEQNIWPFFEGEVLEIFKKYNIDIDYKDDDTFADWLATSHKEGLFDKWKMVELRSLFLLQWMVDLRAGSPNITYPAIIREVYDRNLTKL